MKSFALIFALMLSPHALFADLIKVGNTEVTFEAPQGFQPWSKEVIASKWPTNQPPAYAVGIPSGSTTIAYDLKPNSLSQEDLPKAQKSFQQLFDRIIPGINWKKMKSSNILDKNGF